MTFADFSPLQHPGRSFATRERRLIVQCVSFFALDCTWPVSVVLFSLGGRSFFSCLGAGGLGWAAGGLGPGGLVAWAGFLFIILRWAVFFVALWLVACGRLAVLAWGPGGLLSC